MRLYLMFFFISITLACGGTPNTSNGNSANNANKPATTAVPVYTYEIVKAYPHDSKAFTQGLIFHNGFLYEGTGQEGESTLRKVNISDGKVVKKYDLPREVFAEGIALLNDKIYQLSWRDRTAFVYDINDFKLLQEFRYMGEGWGLTQDGTNLFMSDGTHVLRVINPENFQTVRTIVVMDEKGKPLMKLNELEYVKGEIWANVWHSEDIGKPNHIARIDPNSQKLLGWIDLQNISPDDVRADSENTLNGIAYDPANDRLFVTGKNWKKLFEIKVKPK